MIPIADGEIHKGFYGSLMTELGIWIFSGVCGQEQNR